jgi:Phosphoribosylglycinamide synthetase, ATP-grasp (A) domain
MAARKQLLVVYDHGSLSPVRMAEAAENNDCDLIFVTPTTEHTRKVRPLLEALGRVIEGDRGPDASLIDELRRAAPAGIVTFSEYQLPFATRLADALDLPFHSPGDLGPIIKKDLQRKRLQDSGVDGIRFYEVTKVEQIDDAIAHVGLPAMVKPTIGASSRSTVCARTRGECLAAVGEIVAEDSVAPGPAGRTALVEQFLVGSPVEPPWGDYVGVQCVVRGDEVQPLFVVSKFAVAEPFRERGGYGPQSVLPDPAVRQMRDLACRAVRALNIRTGIADVELKLTSSGPRVIEVNGRLGGFTDDLATRSGSVDAADIAVRSALGVDFDIPFGETNGRLAFHYLVIPPKTATCVSAVDDGLSALRALDVVDRVTITAAVGRPVGWRLGTDTFVAAVVGTVSDHAELADLVSRIEDINWITYR